jgi:hypothetical protein
VRPVSYPVQRSSRRPQMRSSGAVHRGARICNAPRSLVSVPDISLDRMRFDGERSGQMREMYTRLPRKAALV